MTRTGLEIEIRKLRKKLRQIDNLNYVNRELTDAEIMKISQKHDIRERLKNLLQIEKDAQGSNVLEFNDDSFNSNLETSNTSTDGENQTNECFKDDNEHINNTDQRKALDDHQSDILSSIDTEPIESSGDTQHLPAVYERQKSKDCQSEETDANKIKKCTQTSTEHKQKLQEKSSVKPFLDSVFTLLSCEGHNDIVSAVDSDGVYLVTGSRDTTVRLWTVADGKCMKSFGGHTEAVTSVLLLTQQQAANFCEKCEYELELPLDENERIAFSGSNDCSIKIWALQSEQLIKDIYTFNPISCLLYHSGDQLVFAATEGGKIEVWDPFSGLNLTSVLDHTDAISCLKFVDNLLYSSSTAGHIQIHKYSKNHSTNTVTLNRVYNFEDIKSTEGQTVEIQGINSLDVFHNMIYIGDKGSSVKVLDRSEGKVYKVANHAHGVGCSDVVQILDEVLYCSGYDVDDGYSYINCRKVVNDLYMGTLCDHLTERILAMCCCRNATTNELVIVTAGTQVKIWLQEANTGSSRKMQGSADSCVRPLYREEFEAVAANTEHSSSSSDESDDEFTVSRSENKHSSTGWGTSLLNWCSVL